MPTNRLKIRRYRESNKTYCGLLLAIEECGAVILPRIVFRVVCKRKNGRLTADWARLKSPSLACACGFWARAGSCAFEVAESSVVQPKPKHESFV